jgi:hypothetical protein
MMPTASEATPKSRPNALFIGALVLAGLALHVGAQFALRPWQPSNLVNYDLADQIKPLESQADLPFEYVGLDIRGSDQKGPGDLILDFVVIGKYRDTTYYEIDPQKIARQDDYIRKSLDQPLEELKEAAPNLAEKLAKEAPPPRSLQRMFRKACSAGDECRFDGTCQARREGLGWVYSNFRLKGVRPSDSFGFRYVSQDGRSWARETSHQINRLDGRRRMTIFESNDYCCADEYDLSTRKYDAVTDGATLIDLQSAQFNEYATRYAALSKKAYEWKREAEQTAFENLKALSRGFHRLDDKVVSFEMPDASGRPQKWRMEIDFGRYMYGYQGVAVVERTDDPTMRNAYYFIERTSRASDRQAGAQPALPALHLGVRSADHHGAILFGKEHEEPDGPMDWDEVPWMKIVPAGDGYEFHVDQRRAMLQETGERSTNVPLAEIDALLRRTFVAGNRWTGQWYRDEADVEPIELTLLDRGRTDFFTAVLKYGDEPELEQSFDVRSVDTKDHYLCPYQWQLTGSYKAGNTKPMNGHTARSASDLKLRIRGDELFGLWAGRKIELRPVRK